MQIFSTLAVIFVFAFSLLQCDKTSLKGAENAAKTNTNSPVAMATPEEAPRISLADAKKDFDTGSAIFIDTRADASYKAEHIKGAINIPADAFETRYAEVPKDKKIIAYCS
jgi:predicted sulfurtransferase